MNRFDVVVVGAGPAGCATAIACAQRGMRVALLERERFPRHRPGETLHPGIDPLLSELGVDLSQHSCLRHIGHWVQWEGSPQFIQFGDDAYGAWRGFQIQRSHLDGLLLARAKSLGVKVWQPCVKVKVVLTGNRVAGVIVNADRLTSAYIVDASGRHGWLRRQLPIEWRTYSPTLIAHYGYCQGDLEVVHNAPRLTATEEGWQWIARIGSRQLTWTQLSFHSNSTRVARIPDVLKDFPLLNPIRGADVSWRLASEPIGRGYVLVGDAAATLDPAASHGVIKAVISGMQAAKIIAESLMHPNEERDFFGLFKAWQHDQFHADVNALCHFYRAHPYPPVWLNGRQHYGK